jgi:hypothetical protein
MADSPLSFLYIHKGSRETSADIPARNHAAVSAASMSHLRTSLQGNMRNVNLPLNRDEGEEYA